MTGLQRAKLYQKTLSEYAAQLEQALEAGDAEWANALASDIILDAEKISALADAALEGARERG